MRLPASIRNRRGSTLFESAIVAAVFLVMLAGVMEFGRLGFAYNDVSFAAQCAARYAAVRGSSSGHPAAATDVQAAVKVYTALLDNSQITVTTTWTPNNQPGSTVKVTVSYKFATVLLPITKTRVPVQTTAAALITQ